MSTVDNPPTEPERGARQTSRRRLLIAGAIVALALAGAAVYLLANQNATPRTPIAITEFAGDGDETTDPFTVSEGWQIHWDTTGEAFEFAITGDRDFGTVVEQDGPGSGITSPVGSGTFQIEVAAEGPWTITVTQGTR